MLVLQEAEVQMSHAAVRGTMNADSLLVEMPSDFDVAGDAGGIGRFALESKFPHEAIQMDIKGTASVQSLCQSRVCLAFSPYLTVAMQSSQSVASDQAA